MLLSQILTVQKCSHLFLSNFPRIDNFRGIFGLPFLTQEARVSSGGHWLETRASFFYKFTNFLSLTKYRVAHSRRFRSASPFPSGVCSLPLPLPSGGSLRF